MFNGKNLLITGGTGSFGNTVLQRFLETDVNQITVFSRDEKKQDDMRTALRNEKVRFFIGDTRDFQSIRNAMKGVDYVFHAAALKQVPSCEFFPMQAVLTNIIGTQNVVQAAIEANVSKVILLSTDKAVYPINAMGISKAMAEKVILAQARNLTIEAGPIFCITRYGNVMASRGSVIPMFIERIKSGEPILITDQRMTRFLMSLDESVDLVVQAFQKGKQGDIFVQKSPACTIQDLAIAISELFEVDIKTKLIGSRHGEKLYETLLSKEEKTKAQDLGRYWRVPADDRNLNYESYISNGVLASIENDDYNSQNTFRLGIQEIKNLLLTLPLVQEELQSWRGVTKNI